MHAITQPSPPEYAVDSPYHPRVTNLAQNRKARRHRNQSGSDRISRGRTTTTAPSVTGRKSPCEALPKVSIPSPRNVDYSYVESVQYFQRVNVSTRQLQDMGWSEERIKAWAMLGIPSRRFRERSTNPDQYYYRFNDPGEKQEMGKWSPRDRYLFLKQLIESGVDYSVSDGETMDRSGDCFRGRFRAAWGISAATTTDISFARA